MLHGGRGDTEGWKEDLGHIDLLKRILFVGM